MGRLYPQRDKNSMYKRGDLHIGDPYWYLGKVVMFNKYKDIVYTTADNITSKLYIIGYKKQVKQLIDDLNEVLKHLE